MFVKVFVAVPPDAQKYLGENLELLFKSEDLPAKFPAGPVCDYKLSELIAYIEVGFMLQPTYRLVGTWSDYPGNLICDDIKLLEGEIK